jgi:NADH:ubiquinone oxidoreductase subunit D
MKNSLILLKQLLNTLTHSSYMTSNFFYNEFSIEIIIYLFYMLWYINVVGFSVSSIESPKGEYSCSIFIYYGFCNRCRIRCADFIHVLLLDILCRGFLLGDLVAIIGNLDCVFGSVDR